MRKCSVENCGRNHWAKGFCSAHYQRSKKRGEIGVPAIGTPKGARSTWIREHANFLGNECLRWPFSYDPNGYGASGRGRHKIGAHRAMCIAVYGNPPSSSHQAAHRCGNRWCVNPAHLRWALPSENERDKVEHGTSPRGENNSNARLRLAEVLRIKALHRAGIPSNAIAEEYGLYTSYVNKIAAGKVWSHAT